MFSMMWKSGNKEGPWMEEIEREIFCVVWYEQKMLGGMWKIHLNFHWVWRVLCTLEKRRGRTQAGNDVVEGRVRPTKPLDSQLCATDCVAAKDSALLPLFRPISNSFPSSSVLGKLSRSFADGECRLWEELSRLHEASAAVCRKWKWKVEGKNLLSTVRLFKLHQASLQPPSIHRHNTKSSIFQIKICCRSA